MDTKSTHTSSTSSNSQAVFLSIPSLSLYLSMCASFLGQWYTVLHKFLTQELTITNERKLWSLRFYLRATWIEMTALGMPTYLCLFVKSTYVFLLSPIPCIACKMLGCFFLLQNSRLFNANEWVLVFLFKKNFFFLVWNSCHSLWIFFRILCDLNFDCKSRKKRLAYLQTCLQHNQFEMQGKLLKKNEQICIAFLLHFISILFFLFCGKEYPLSVQMTWHKMLVW